MKKILMALMCVAGLFLTACNSQSELKDDKVYFFYQTTCPHCHSAIKYIKAKYPELKMVDCDIKLPGNMRLFQKAVRKYEIKDGAGTPLFAMGDKYIMGWGKDDEKLFDMYIKPYLKK